MLFYYAECRILFTIMLNVVMLSVIKLSVIMLSIIMLSVLAPYYYIFKNEDPPN